MTKSQQEKIKKFLGDPNMTDSVFQGILDSFLKPRPNKDVYYLAAKMLAVEFLDEARKDLNRLKDDEPKEAVVTKQIGL